MKKIIYLLIIVVVFFGFYKLLSIPPKNNNSANSSSNNPTESQNFDLIFYYGITCPHCKNVEDFISQNQLDQKIKILSKEVYQNSDNAKELEETVNKYCPDLNQGGIGVPLALDVQNQKCIQGDVPIIDFLKQKN